MRHFGSGARRLAVLTVPIMALSLLGSGGASASVSGASRASGAAGHAVPASGVTWHRLTGINGWHSGQSRYSTGDPSWGISGGVVYLAGSVIRSSGTSTLLAVLPSQARPSHQLFITVYTLNDTTGSLVISPNGKMRAYNGTGNAAGFTSLAGVSFPARTLAQKKLTLLNSWQSSQAAFNSGDPSYAVSGGLVYLSGSLQQSAGNDIFATLPKVAAEAGM